MTVSDSAPAAIDFGALAEPAPGRKGLRILHVVRQYTPSIGGLETYVEQLVERQARTHRVHILTLDRVFGQPARLSRLERMYHAPVHRIGFVGSRQFFIPFLNPAWLRKFDIVHIHATDQLLDLIHLARLAGAPPYVVTSHGLFFHTASLRRVKEIYLRAITRFSLKGAAAVFAISRNDADIMARVGVDSELMRNPIEPFAPPIADGGDMIYIGRVSQNKRVELLIDVLAAVRRTDLTMRLHIVGGDSEGLTDGVKQRAVDRGVADAVAFHGFVDRAQMEALCAASRYLVSASRYEGFGISLVEGMSKGLLPVVHDNAAFRETVELAGVGLLTQFDDPERAAAAFLAWRDSVGRQDQIAAREFALTHSWDHVVERLEEIYAGARA